jgi:sugar phosphate permease
LAARIRPDGSTDDRLVCTSFLLLGVGCSLLAGWVTALVDARRWRALAGVQAAVLLAVGIVVEVSAWELVPAWYHVVFLLLLVPCTLFGARLRARSASPLAAPSRSAV